MQKRNIFYTAADPTSEKRNIFYTAFGSDLCVKDFFFTQLRIRPLCKRTVFYTAGDLAVGSDGQIWIRPPDLDSACLTKINLARRHLNGFWIGLKFWKAVNTLFHLSIGFMGLLGRYLFA